MRRKGSIWITVGLLLMAAALCLTIKNVWEEARAGKIAAKVTLQLRGQPTIVQRPSEPMPEIVTGDEALQTTEGLLDDLTQDEKIEPEMPLYQSYPEMEMPTAEVDSERYIGLLSIPVLDLELPIMNDWDEEKLKHTPCRYAGSAYTGDLVIAGHNYRTHFGKLVHLTTGDLITFTDVDGNVFTYQMAVRETLIPTAVEEMTNGVWDLTLFTCTFGNSHRTTIRCERVDHP